MLLHRIFPYLLWLFIGLMLFTGQAFSFQVKTVRENPLALPKSNMVKTYKYIAPLPAVPVSPVMRAELPSLVSFSDTILAVVSGAVAAFAVTGLAMAYNRRKRIHVKSGNPQSDFIGKFGKRFKRTRGALDSRTVGQGVDEPHVRKSELSELLARADRKGRDNPSYAPRSRVSHDSALGAWADAIRTHTKAEWPR